MVPVASKMTDPPLPTPLSIVIIHFSVICVLVNKNVLLCYLTEMCGVYLRWSFS